MDTRKFNFLQAVLGADGAGALAKAAQRSPSLEAALLPRAIMAWLGVMARASYEGGIPGAGNSYLAFEKSEDRYSGTVGIGETLYSFEKASLYHLGACVAVALGADHERVSPGLRDLDIERLGKSIDLLAKARITVAELKKSRLEPLAKAIADIAPGKVVSEAGPRKLFDYSHVLTPQHQKAGYRLHLTQSGIDSAKLVGQVFHGKTPVGYVRADHDPDGSLYIDEAEVEDDHQRKGLGPALYEAVMAHGYHHLGARAVSGGVHSTHAAKVHQKLGTKHGLDYRAGPNPDPSTVARRVGAYDNRYGAYEYAIKQEVPMSKAGGHEAPGPAHAPTAPQGPVTPTPAAPTQTSKGPTVGMRPKLPKPPKPASPMAVPGAQGQKQGSGVHVTKAEASAKCSMCGSVQFGSGKFVGCHCFRALAKHVRSTADAAGYRLEFGAEWDRDSILTLLESMGRK